MYFRTHYGIFCVAPPGSSKIPTFADRHKGSCYGKKDWVAAPVFASEAPDIFFRSSKSAPGIASMAGANR